MFFFSCVCFFVWFGIAFKIDYKFHLRNIFDNFETSLVVLETSNIDGSNSNDNRPFTVVCLVAWPLNESKAGDDLVLIETSPLFFC